MWNELFFMPKSMWSGIKKKYFYEGLRAGIILYYVKFPFTEIQTITAWKINRFELFI